LAKKAGPCDVRFTSAILHPLRGSELPTVRHHLDEAKRIHDGLARTL